MSRVTESEPRRFFRQLGQIFCLMLALPGVLAATILVLVGGDTLYSQNSIGSKVALAALVAMVAGGWIVSRRRDKQGKPLGRILMSSGLILLAAIGGGPEAWRDSSGLGGVAWLFLVCVIGMGTVGLAGFHHLGHKEPPDPIGRGPGPGTTDRKDQ